VVLLAALVGCAPAVDRVVPAEPSASELEAAFLLEQLSESRGRDLVPLGHGLAEAVHPGEALVMGDAHPGEAFGDAG
jgi:hypothetical protein